MSSSVGVGAASCPPASASWSTSTRCPRTATSYDSPATNRTSSCAMSPVPGSNAVVCTWSISTLPAGSVLLSSVNTRGGTSGRCDGYARQGPWSLRSALTVHGRDSVMARLPAAWPGIQRGPEPGVVHDLLERHLPVKAEHGPRVERLDDRLAGAAPPARLRNILSSFYTL